MSILTLKKSLGAGKYELIGYVVDQGCSAIERIRALAEGLPAINAIRAAKIMGKMVANKEIWVLNNDKDERIGASFFTHPEVDWYQKSFINNLAIANAVIHQMQINQRA